MEISLNSRGIVLSSLERVRVTSAMLEGLRLSVPLKMTSVISEALSPLADCSPMTHRTPSETLVLPQPLGPTTAVTPGSNKSSVLSAKDLNPWISSFFRYKPYFSKKGMENRPKKCGENVETAQFSQTLSLQGVDGKGFQTTKYSGNSADSF